MKTKALFVAGVLGLAAIGSALVVLVIDSRRECARQVEIRDDQRSMWLYALEQNPDNPQAAAFRLVLDQRIPPLECGGLINVQPHPVETP